jgi:hypothetical protein
MTMGTNQKTSWKIIRTILFLVVGLMNTILIKPEDIGSFKNYLGYGLLILGLIDAFFLIRSKIKCRKIQ